MLKRKISETLKKWREQPNHFPLVIMGIRQCGKTYISQLFAEENYKHVVYINFIKHKNRKEAFYDSKDVDSIILNLSAQMRTAKFVTDDDCGMGLECTVGEKEANLYDVSLVVLHR